MEKTEKTEKLIKLLSGVRPDVDFANETRLVSDGIIDSFDIVAVVADINDTFGVNVGVIDLLPENFDSAGAMLELIQRKLK